MKTTEIFSTNAKKLNESFEKTFGQKLKLESFTVAQLEDARNRIRTQLSQVRSSSGFNETIENEAFSKAQWMLDSINAELAERFEDTAIHPENIQVEDSEQTEQTGEDMKQVRESAADKAGAVVVAKDMTDKVGRWIEELSGMENDQLISLGDTIRDEMGQEQAKAYLEAVAPAIQQALQNLKTTREILASGMRSLTGEEQSAEIIGAEPGAEGGDMSVEPDAMNPEVPAGDEEFGGFDTEAPADEFAAAEPAAGGAEEAGRMKRESIDRQSNLLRVLAG